MRSKDPSAAIPVPKGEPAMEPAPSTLPNDTTARTKIPPQCTHSRIVDEVLTTKGTKTGLLICKECLAVFPDPTYQEAGH